MTIISFGAPQITVADLAGVYEWAATFGWHVWHSPENDPIRLEAGQEAILVERLDDARRGVSEGWQKSLVDAWTITRERRGWRVRPADDVAGVSGQRCQSLSEALAAICVPPAIVA